MENFYTSFALITAGIGFAMGCVHLVLPSTRRNTSSLLFCLMGLSLICFFLVPPIGFILNDTAPYPANILIKRIFIYSYYAITPWFILAYSGYPRKILAYAMVIIAVTGYIVMATTTTSVGKPMWSLISVAGFGCILILGLQAARWQYRNGQKADSYWLASAMFVYGVLFVLTAFNQFTDGTVGAIFSMKLFFPMHFHSLVFMIIMGQRLVVKLLAKYKVGNIEIRTQSFIKSAPFFIIELDREGRIVYINNYGINLLGYTRLDELRMMNWFDNFLAPADGVYFKALYQRIVNQHAIESITSTIRDKQGRELVINWYNFAITSTEAGSQNVMSIGKDITEDEKTSKLIEKLKNDLLKEQIVFNKEETGILNEEIVGSSKALKYALQKAQQVSNTQAPVLLEGETGVGKELFADLIHKNSSRANKPFIKVNCCALPKELFEAELFGHEKGAFTSASQARKGRFELADGGTIFLDEIGELPLDMQPKLLRVLQCGELERIGGQKTLKIDVRILAATNRSLIKEVNDGAFRSDLYYRLNVFPITIPPLRNRKEDLPTLIKYFISQKSKIYNKQLTEISNTNMQFLINYDWPGNIRELKNVIERSVILSEGKTLLLDWWGESNAELETATDNSLEHVEHDHILSVLQKAHWRINGENGAAEILAMHPNTLRSKMKKLNIKRPAAHSYSSPAIEHTPPQ